MKWSLVKITLKHNLGLFILSFKSWTLTYITYLKSPFWLNVDTWTEEFLPWEIFHNQQGCCLFSSANKKILINLSLVRDEFWIVKCIIRQSKKEKEKWKRTKMERKNDSRVKTRKGSLEQKQENFESLMGEANRRMKGQWSNSIRSLYEVLYLFQRKKVEPSFPKCLPLNSRTYHGGSWRLSNCHIQEQQKWIFLRCLIFK